MVRTHGGLGVCVIVCTLLLPGVASAQQATASGIAGVVRDTSGAVLPGVTVEAAQSGAHRTAPQRRQRRRGPLQHRRSAARLVRGHVLPHRFQHLQA